MLAEVQELVLSSSHSDALLLQVHNKTGCLRIPASASGTTSKLNLGA